MEIAEGISDAAPISAEVAAQDASIEATNEDASSRKRAREADDEEAPSKNETLPDHLQDVNPNKRSRNDGDSVDENSESSPAGVISAAADNPEEDATKLSKNQLRKQRRQQRMEERKENRKQQRKDKRHEKSARKREEREVKAEELAQALGIDKEDALRRVGQQEHQKNKKTTHGHRPVPVAIIIDCDFEKYMRENELVSLAGQITRSYSMNRMGTYMAHLVVSSWGGKLKERFETVLKSHHHQWKGVTFVEGDFVEGGKKAWDIMNSSKGEKSCPALGGEPENNQTEESLKEDGNPASSVAGENPEPSEQPPAPGFSSDSIVYLSADSPHTLEKLEPNTSYVIGGLVDRNREKNLCQRRAEEKGIRTAKLPIGEYLQMSSRKVLATNHVVEIMSKWLETGDWAQAFMEVIPKRKGGELKGAGADDKDEDDKDEEDVTAKEGVDHEMVDAGVDIKNGEKQENGVAETKA
ncbi:tRNA (guanine(9)-N(1))-methyltransferase [Gnomoniopsis smithogilvyi]|uniref:tRNA (guanine(9)-N1)-methyltransferase n=1 Tax=Gnomoniopsis smithogilvyi TaxID=1191159 RepID=A0A9W8YN27_9PEZI|nr:tRNA (guanine(9)-N(1))-methyltransferase [Gnomoniopsis smithogilvyi]